MEIDRRRLSQIEIGRNRKRWIEKRERQIELGRDRYRQIQMGRIIDLNRDFEPQIAEERDRQK